MFIIGIDSHKGSHTAAVIDGGEQAVGELSVRADRSQRDRLLRWARDFAPRMWAIEGATGTGALRLFAQRYHQVIAGRTRAICRLHAVLCAMIEGGLPRDLSAKRAPIELRKLRPLDAIGIERKRIAAEFLDEVRRHNHALVEFRRASSPPSPRPTRR